MTALLRPEQRWSCPNCNQETVTHEAKPHTRFHACRGLRGLVAPMIPAGTKARVYLREREDYVGADLVQRDPQLGRPVMSVVTERPDGSNDAVVFAPTAHAEIGEM